MHITAQPCKMGEMSLRNNPANAEMALAFAIHDYSQQLLKMSHPVLDATRTGFQEWLRTLEQSIAYYRHSTQKMDVVMAEMESPLLLKEKK